MAFKEFINGGSKIVKDGWSLLEKIKEEGADVLAVAVPTTALAAAYIVSKLRSPSGVRENLNDIVINANEKAMLASSIRDFERLKARKRLQSTAKIHDQFV